MKDPQNRFSGSGGAMKERAAKQGRVASRSGLQCCRRGREEREGLGTNCSTVETAEGATTSWRSGRESSA